MDEPLLPTPDASGPPPHRDDDAEHPVAGAWRPVFRAIVGALARHDYGAVGEIASVEPVSADQVTQIRENVTSYGATLVDLSDETWNSSVARWMGTHWDVLVDLWTAEEGWSDLVLRARVSGTESGFRFQVEIVDVP